jgi:predicted nuclease of restriction endonuclease-like RecB superfamily
MGERILVLRDYNLERNDAESCLSVAIDFAGQLRMMRTLVQQLTGYGLGLCASLPALVSAPQWKMA